MDTIRDKGDTIRLDDIVFRGDDGVLCVEAGGPTPGVGCAGRGIIAAFEKLAQLKAFETYKPDVVLYDVLGDVVCGGFAMPIRNGYAKDVIHCNIRRDDVDVCCIEYCFCSPEFPDKGLCTARRPYRQRKGNYK